MDNATSPPSAAETSSSSAPKPSFFYNVVNFFDNKLGSRVESLAETAGEALETATSKALLSDQQNSPTTPTARKRAWAEEVEMEYTQKLQRELQQQQAEYEGKIEQSHVEMEAIFAAEREEFRAQLESQANAHAQVDIALRKELTVAQRHSEAMNLRVSELEAKICEMQRVREEELLQVETTERLRVSELEQELAAKQQALESCEMALQTTLQSKETALKQCEEDFQQAMQEAREEINSARCTQDESQRVETECKAYMLQAKQEIDQCRQNEQAALEALKQQEEQLRGEMQRNIDKEKQVFEVTLTRATQEHELKLAAQQSEFDNNTASLQQELLQLKSTLDETTDKLDDAVNVIQALEEASNDMQAMEAKLNAALLRNQDLDVETSALRAQLEAASAELECAKRDIDLLTEAKLETEQQLGQAKLDCASFEQKLTQSNLNVEEQVAQLKQDISQREQAIARLQQELDTIAQSTSEQVSQAKLECARLSQDLDNANVAHAQVQSEINALETANTGLLKELGALQRNDQMRQREIAALEEGKSEQLAQLARMEQEFAQTKLNLSEELEQVRGKVTQREQEINRLQQELDSSAGDQLKPVEALQHEINTLEMVNAGLLQELQSNNAQLHQELRINNEELEASRNILHELESARSEVNALSEAKLKFEQQLAQANETCASLTENIVELKQACSQHETEIVRMQQEVDSALGVQEECTRLSQELDNAKRDLAHFQDASPPVEALQSEINTLEAANSGLLQELKALHNDGQYDAVALLQQELDAKQDELQALRNKLEESGRELAALMEAKVNMEQEQQVSAAQELSHREQEISRLQQELDSALDSSAQLDQAKLDCARLSDELANAKLDFTRVQDSVEALQRETNALEAANSSLLQELEALRSNSNDGQRDAVALLQQELDAKQDELQALRNKLEESGREIATLMEAKVNLEQQREQEISRLQQELDSALNSSAQRGQANIDCARLSDELANAKLDFTRVQESVEALQRETNALEAANSSLLQELEALRSNDGQQDALTLLQQELDAKQDELRNKEATAQNVQDKYESQLAAAQAEITRLIAQLEVSKPEHDDQSLKAALEIQREEIKAEFKAKAEIVVQKRLEREKLRLQEEVSAAHATELERVREDIKQEMKAKAEIVVQKRVERERLRLQAEHAESTQASQEEKLALLRELADLRSQVEAALEELKQHKQSNKMLKQEVAAQANLVSQVIDGERVLQAQREVQVQGAVQNVRVGGLQAVLHTLEQAKLASAFQAWRKFAKRRL